MDQDVRQVEQLCMGKDQMQMDRTDCNIDYTYKNTCQEPPCTLNDVTSISLPSAYC